MKSLILVSLAVTAIMSSGCATMDDFRHRLGRGMQTAGQGYTQAGEAQEPRGYSCLNIGNGMYNCNDGQGNTKSCSNLGGNISCR